MLWTPQVVIVDRASIARVAENLGAAWHTVNTAGVASRQLLIDDPARFNRAQVLAVDEHVWHHTCYGASLS